MQIIINNRLLQPLNSFVWYNAKQKNPAEHQFHYFIRCDFACICHIGNIYQFQRNVLIKSWYWFQPHLPASTMKVAGETDCQKDLASHQLNNKCHVRFQCLLLSKNVINVSVTWQDNVLLIFFLSCCTFQKYSPWSDQTSLSGLPRPLNHETACCCLERTAWNTMPQYVINWSQRSELVPLHTKTSFDVI